MGSKNRIAKEILPIILKDRKDGQWYVEPFVGGANLIDKVGGNRIGADSNEYLIELLIKLRDGWLPPQKITKEEYLNIKDNIEKYPKHLVGYVAFQLSFGSMWFGSYRRDNTNQRDYSLEAYHNVKKQAPNLKNIDFKNCSYRDLEIPPNSIIYCDPPYENTASYKGSEDFNHGLFWGWCREQAQNGHAIFVSEYNAPPDFECVWSKPLRNGISKKTAQEKLFTLKPEN